MAGPPSLSSINMTKEDGSLFNRTEMEAQIREVWPSHQHKRLQAISLYGLSTKIAYDTPTVVVLHWMLDEMIRRKEVKGSLLGVELPAPGYYDDPVHQKQFTQRIAIAVNQGVALMPPKGEGIDVNDIKSPPNPVGEVPSNGQPAGITPFTPPPAPTMGAAPAVAQQHEPETTAGGGIIFPKEDPTRIWGKAAGDRKRRNKQEQGEDKLWEALGKPQNLQYASFASVYGMEYKAAKAQGALGADGTDFPSITDTQTTPVQTTPVQAQQGSNTMNTPPMPPMPPQTAVPQGAVMPPPPPQMPGVPQAPGQAPVAPAQHAMAPMVPPPPGAAIPQPQAPGLPPQAAPQPMGPPQVVGPPPSSGPSPTDTKILEQQADIINRLAAIEASQKVIDTALSVYVRVTYQKPGNYTCTEALRDAGLPVPQ